MIRPILDTLSKAVAFAAGGVVLATQLAPVAIADGMPTEAVRQPPLRGTSRDYYAQVRMPDRGGWSGFYVGANLGYGFGNSDVHSSFTCPPGACVYNDPSTLGAFGNAGRSRMSPNDWTGGGQVGYNWQHGLAIFGVETDFNAFSLGAGRSFSGVAPASFGQSFAMRTAVDSDWLFTARGRLGADIAPGLMGYITGGVAVVNLSVSNSFSDGVAGLGGFTTNTAGGSSGSGARAGWTLGGGFEWALLRHWSMKAEYLYVDLGSVSTSASVQNPQATGVNRFDTSTDLNVHIIRTGLNYKF